jgi:hypothetical protein
MTRPQPSVAVQAWVEQRVTGPGGFQAFEAHEMPLFTHERDVELATFVIRCLANPACEGSAEVLDAIATRRREVARG